MVLLTRHEESIKARLWFAFEQYLQPLQTTFPHILLQPLNLLENFIKLLLLLLLLPLQKLSKVFWFSKPWKQNLCYSSFSFPSPFAKNNSPRTNRLNSFCVFFLPFPKEQRTNRLDSFVSPFSLVKEFKTTQSENSFDSSHSLIQKRSKVSPPENSFVSPFTKYQRCNSLRSLS